MKLPTGDDSFFPSYFVTERRNTLEVQPISMTKDHELRRRMSAALEKGPGMHMVLSGPDLFKVLAVSSTDVTEDLINIAAFIFDQDPEMIGATLALPEIIEVIVSCLYTPTEKSDEERVAAGNVWTLSRVIDFFGHEYSWTIAETLGMSRHQLKTLLNAVEERYDDERKAYEDSKDGRSGLTGAEGRMNNTNLLNKSKAKPKHRMKMDVGQEGKPEPDWSTSEGSNSLQMFATTLGIPIKKEGNV